MPDDTGDTHPVTVLLQRARAGEEGAASELFDRLYGELHARARRVAEGSDATLQPTALVHEAWLKMVPEHSQGYADRQHFLRLAATAMRSVMIDHVRARKAKKRDGQRVLVELDALAGIYEQRAVDLLTLEEALGKLAQLDAQLVQIVELRFFAGLQVDEVAAALDTSVSTVERAWRTARTWLKAELGAP